MAAGQLSCEMAQGACSYHAGASIRTALARQGFPLRWLQAFALG